MKQLNFKLAFEHLPREIKSWGAELLANVEHAMRIDLAIVLLAFVEDVGLP